MRKAQKIPSGDAFRLDGGLRMALRTNRCAG